MSIVFMRDWSKFPRAIPDTTTRNKSFLKIAKLYKEMGIRNYFFHLALLQPELRGVDPHSDNLTLEQKAMILYEVDNNPWYFIRECVLVAGTGNTPVEMLYKANRANIAALWLLLASIDYIQIQPRQTGKSFGTDVNTYWLLYHRYKNTQLNIITKDDVTRVNNVNRIKTIREQLPGYLIRHTKTDDNNQQTMSCNELNNKLYTHVAQSSKKRADNLGRGLTSPYVQVDEGPFVRHVATTIASAMGSMNTARENAAKMGYPYCTIFTTTAGNPEDEDGYYMYKIWSNAAPWDERFLDAANREELVAMIKVNKHGLDVTVNLTMSAMQCGKTREWLLDAVARARSDGANIDRDYFNIWTSGNDEGLIAKDIAARVRESEMEPIHVEMSTEGYIFRWFEDWDPREQYILNVDTSDAIGRDDIAVTLLNLRTGATAGTGFFNEINLRKFAYWLSEMLIKYKNTTLLIERQYNAQVIIDFLIIELLEAGEDPFKRMYNEVVQERDTNPERYNQVFGNRRNASVYDKLKSTFGFKTNQSSRKLLYGTVLFNALDRFAGSVRDSKVIGQMLSLTIKNGRVDHATGSHDDMVIAWLLGHWFMNHGLNMKDYGIRTSDVLNIEDDKPKTDDEIVDSYFQSELRKRIEAVGAELEKTKDTTDIILLEAELKYLTSQLKETSDRESTLDAILEKTRAARRLSNADNTKFRSASALLQAYG